MCRQLKEDFPLIDADATSTLVPKFPESEEQLLVRTAEVGSAALASWLMADAALGRRLTRCRVHRLMPQAAQQISDRYYPEHVLFVSHAPVNLGTCTQD